ncbi:hydrogen gas-evolving membrane-bound hydrogenase subunit E [Pseudoxanthobacter sp.]|uniref:hydrogen gas-evolving membrane-bound hydrogenase subunit E n=1 Tax=Pseudoxanthobacter sp. TaxID=1925742 RepID=UPI002FE02134
MRTVLAGLAVFLFAIVAAAVVIGYSEQTALRPLAAFYVGRGPQELGLPNVVTGILITYRGFDTLGEVAVLFMVAAGVGILLTKAPGEAAGDETADEATASAAQPPLQPAGEIVRTGMEVLLPLIFLFGAYVILHGHLSAGGGFQGGAIVASGTMLLLVTRPQTRLKQKLLSLIESSAGVFYVLTGILGLLVADGFLDNRILPLGTFGAVMSAGAIPLISALLGIKVGAELSVILDRFHL